ncbi:MAG: F0F1 ATP synthase subunit B [Candidatus Magasanikbacteria bacterium]|jgi:F-type H+-transporting ATPase subunit b|nr:F0F1 ATP synthase subunit B [Candidatus Magasanikbacteria bacterium]MBT4071656.1 F0F1 ATP synthase subunit B [Candidatus Magasanikbacteria bacterium]
MDYILDTLGKVGFEWKMGLFNFLNFLVVFLILKKYAFKPITKVIAERQKKAEDTVENFQKAKSELQMAEQKAQTLIDEAKVEANRTIEKSHETAQAQAVDMKEKAKAEIESLIVQAKKNIAIDRLEMQDSLRTETVELVIKVVEKIVGNKLDNATDDAYIKDVLATLK